MRTIQGIARLPLLVLSLGFIIGIIIGAALPQLVLLSVSAFNRSKLPDGKVLELLDGYPILRTDMHGSIELVTDGDRMWILAEN